MLDIENVVLLPGYGEPDKNRWQHLEVDIARDAGMRTFYPQDVPGFVNGTPNKIDFEQYVSDLFERNGLEPDRTVVLAHSLGGNGWLHVLERRLEMRECLTTLIGTPLENKTGVDEVNDFFPTAKFLGDSGLKDEEAQRILLVGSDVDPITKEDAHVLAQRLDVAHLVIPAAGHFMPRSRHGSENFMDLGREWRRVRQMISRLHLPY